MKWKNKISSATPFIVIIAIVLLQTYFPNPYWWFLLLLIPIVPILCGLIKIRFSYELLCVTAFVIMGLALPNHPWHPAWVILLTIPIYHIFIDKKDDDKIEVKGTKKD